MENRFSYSTSRFVLVTMTLLFLVSCKQKNFDSEKELWSYVKEPENGYFHEKTIGKVKYGLTYRPTDILVRQELGDDFTKQHVDSLRQKYGEYLYFNLNVSVNEQEVLNTQIGSRDDFGAMVNQLAFGMGSKVHLISKKRDTVSIADYIYPRMYGMANSTNLLLVYPREEKILDGEFFLLSVEDFGLGTGEINFKVPTAILTNEPKLNFKNTL